MNERLEAALGYTKRERYVFPLQWPTPDGKCSCGKDCGNNAAKHPLTNHGFKDATIDETFVDWLVGQGLHRNIERLTVGGDFPTKNPDVSIA